MKALMGFRRPCFGPGGAFGIVDNEVGVEVDQHPINAVIKFDPGLDEEAERSVGAEPLNKDHCDPCSSTKYSNAFCSTSCAFGMSAALKLAACWKFPSLSL